MLKAGCFHGSPSFLRYDRFGSQRDTRHMPQAALNLPSHRFFMVSMQLGHVWCNLRLKLKWCGVSSVFKAGIHAVCAIAPHPSGSLFLRGPYIIIFYEPQSSRCILEQFSQSFPTT